MNPNGMLGGQAGNNLANAFSRVKDENTIENILSQAMSANDPAVMQQSIGKILSSVSPERQGAALKFLQGTYEGLQKKQEEAKHKIAAEKAGIDPNLPKELQIEQYKANAKNARLKEYYPNSGSNSGVPSAMGGLALQNPQAAIGGIAAQNPQAAIGGIAPQNQQGQPQPPQQQPQGQPTQQMPNENPFSRFSRGQLVAMAGHPDREVSEPAKQQITYLDEQEKANQKKVENDRKEQISFHQETQKFDEDLIKSSRIAKNQIDTIDSIEKAIESDEIKPSSWANILKGFGPIGDKISEAIVNDKQAILQSSIPQLLEGWKEVFGVRLTDADLRLLQDKLPSIGKSKEANLAITSILRKYADLTLLRNDIARQIKKDNKGLRPLGYADLIEERYEEMTAPIEIISPTNGKPMSIPAYKLSHALEDGAKLAPKKVAPEVQNEF